LRLLLFSFETPATVKLWARAGMVLA
jgi:hypothetical protein